MEVETVLFNGASECRVVKVKARRNELVSKDQILLLYESSPGNSDGHDGKFRSKFMGSVVDFLVKEGDLISHGFVGVAFWIFVLVRF